MNNYNMLLVAILIFIMLFSVIMLYNKANIAFLNILIVIIILFNVYYWFYYRKMVLYRCEKFENDIDDMPLLAPCNSDNCVYTGDRFQKSGNDNLQYHKDFYKNAIADKYGSYTDIMKGDPLLTFNCMKIAPFIRNMFLRYDKNNKKNDIFSYKYSKIYNINDNSLVNHIKSELEAIIINIKKTDITASKIKGPVYAIISQSPYLRYNSQIINARFDTTNNKYSYYNETLEDNKIISSFDKNKALYTEIILVFPSYKTIKQSDNSISYVFESYEKTNYFLNEIKRFVETNSDLCFLKCNNSFNLTCGCLNSTPSMNKDIPGSLSGPEGTKGYTAKCLSEKNEKTDYSMMYFLNPYNPVFNNLIFNHLQ